MVNSNLIWNTTVNNIDINIVQQGSKVINYSKNTHFGPNV